MTNTRPSPISPVRAAETIAAQNTRGDKIFDDYFDLQFSATG
jgi:hypothetical protein